MTTEKDPQTRFWVEAQVSIAKSAVLLATAQEETERGELASASVNAYYSLYHLSLSLMWLLPESIHPSLHQALIAIRDSGDELPNKMISHKKAEDFLCAVQLNLSVPNLTSLYKLSLRLREFVSYGPRVTYDGTHPLLGPCSFNLEQVRMVVQGAPHVFTNALKAAFPKTAYKGDLALIVIDGAIKLLQEAEFPFKRWYSKSALEKAEILINGLRNDQST